MASAPAFKLKGVRFRYRDSDPWLFDGLSLYLGRGKYLGLMGRSGSGKSTLVSLLSGIAPSMTGGELQGDIEVCGTTLPAPLTQVSSIESVVFQAPEEMFVQERVGDEISFSLRARGMDRGEAHRRCGKAVSDLGIEGLIHRRTRDLSGGEQTLVAVAAAVVTDPGLLVLDEPSSELDPLSRSRLMKGIRALRERRPEMSVLQIEQDMSSLFLCDEVAVLRAGGIGIQGPPGRTFRDRGGLERSGLATAPIFTTSLLAEERKLGAFRDCPLRRLPVALGDGLKGKLPPLRPEKDLENTRTGKLLLEEVSFHYPGTMAGISDIDLDLSKERSVAIMGPNGSGKSTLGKLICGLMPPDRGSVISDDVPFHLFQKPSNMFFEMTVGLEAELGGIEKEVMRKLGLYSLFGSDPLLLSEGEKQRLGIALALSFKGRAVVLDEPFKGLDGPMRELVWGMLGSYGAPAHILITNDPEVAGRCERLVLLKGGRPIADGRPEEVLNDMGPMAALGWAMSVPGVVARRAGAGKVSSFGPVIKALEGMKGGAK